jgi:hypothetical protein
MNSQINSLLDSIESMKMERGQSAYFRLQDNVIKLTDESALRTVILSGSISSEKEEFFGKIANDVAELLNNLSMIGDCYDKLTDEGFRYYYSNRHRDSIEIKITDHCIYITEFASGQY